MTHEELKKEARNTFNNYDQSVFYWIDKAVANYKEELIKEIEKVKEAVQTQTGSFKYDSCYDDIIELIKK